MQDPAQSPQSLPIIHLAHFESSSQFWNFCDTEFLVTVHLRGGRRLFSADTLVITLFTSLVRWLHILIANGDLGSSANSARPSGCIWRGKRPRSKSLIVHFHLVDLYQLINFQLSQDIRSAVLIFDASFLKNLTSRALPNLTFPPKFLSMAPGRRKNRPADMAQSTGLQKSQSTASGRKRKTYDALEYTRNRMGLKPTIETRPGTHSPELSWWPRMRLIFREPLLEFWGTLVMMLLGGSVTAVTTLSEYQYGNWLTICFGWSAAMIFGIYVAGDSGAYLNPAITLTNCLFRGLPLRRWPVYAAAQILGAFCGHGLVYANYISAIDQYEGHAIRTIPPSPTTSAKIFCQFPQPFVPLGSQIFSEFIANFFMTFLILAIRDENGADLKGGGFFVIAFFWLNFVVMAAFGWETG